MITSILSPRGGRAVGCHAQSSEDCPRDSRPHGSDPPRGAWRNAGSHVSRSTPSVCYDIIQQTHRGNQQLGRALGKSSRDESLSLCVPSLAKSCAHT